jgi:hypothetical protein
MGPATSGFGVSIDVFLCGRRLVHNSYGDGYLSIHIMRVTKLYSAALM